MKNPETLDFPLNPLTPGVLYEESRCTVDVEGDLSAEYMVSIGVPKGDLLSPFLFTLVLC